MASCILNYGSLPLGPGNISGKVYLVDCDIFFPLKQSQKETKLGSKTFQICLDSYRTFQFQLISFQFHVLPAGEAEEADFFPQLHI